MKLSLSAALLLFAFLLVAGCGRSTHLKGSHVVSVTLSPAPEGVGRWIATPKPPTDTSGSYVPLEAVRRLIPRVLPSNPAQKCRYGSSVELRLDSGTAVDYGPRSLPPAIDRLSEAIYHYSVRHPFRLIPVKMGIRFADEFRALVRKSDARLKALTVDTRKRRLVIEVSVADPAAYLEHRYATVVRYVYPGLASLFTSIYLEVFDRRTSHSVLSFSDASVPAPGTRQQAWTIAPKLLGCARNLPLDDIEIDPERAAPPCPAR